MSGGSGGGAGGDGGDGTDGMGSATAMGPDTGVSAMGVDPSSVAAALGFAPGFGNVGNPQGAPPGMSTNMGAPPGVDPGMFGGMSISGQPAALGGLTGMSVAGVNAPGSTYGGISTSGVTGAQGAYGGAPSGAGGSPSGTTGGSVGAFGGGPAGAVGGGPGGMMGATAVSQPTMLSPLAVVANNPLALAIQQQKQNMMLAMMQAYGFPAGLASVNAQSQAQNALSNPAVVSQLNALLGQLADNPANATNTITAINNLMKSMPSSPTPSTIGFPSMGLNAMGQAVDSPPGLSSAIASGVPPGAMGQTAQMGQPASSTGMGSVFGASSMGLPMGMTNMTALAPGGQPAAPGQQSLMASQFPGLTGAQFYALASRAPWLLNARGGT